jgi:hypothetical protein
MTRHHDVHVIVTRVRRWRVKQGGRTLSNHLTQHDRVELVTHGPNGRIGSKDSDGNESGACDTEH